MSKSEAENHYVFCELPLSGYTVTIRTSVQYHNETGTEINTLPYYLKLVIKKESPHSDLNLCKLYYTGVYFTSNSLLFNDLLKVFVDLRVGFTGLVQVQSPGSIPTEPPVPNWYKILQTFSINCQIQHTSQTKGLKQ